MSFTYYVYNRKGFATMLPVLTMRPIFAYALSMLVFERENWKPQCNLTSLESTSRVRQKRIN